MSKPIVTLDDAFPRTDRRGRIAVGPTYAARLSPWVRMGAPLLAVVVLPLSSLATLRLDWWLRLPVALVIGWAVLAALMAIGLAAVHRTTWFDPASGTLVRGRTRIPVADIARVADDFRSHGTTEVRGRDRQVLLAIPATGWDDASFDGVRALQVAVGQNPAPTRGEYARRDNRARLFHENRALATRYAIPWRNEFEDPGVFLAAFDERRRELKAARRYS
ncbi:MAG: hypothetical protein Q4G21_08585 [Dermabacter sp.]|nr:hypothetical protein [Dermabacter sp.]